MKKLILIILLGIGNATADENSIQTTKDIKGWYFIGGTPQPQTTLKTIVNKDGHMTITDGGKWEENARSTRPPGGDNVQNNSPAQSNSGQIDLHAALEHAKELLETGGWGGLTEAPQYMDIIDSQVTAQNCTPGNVQPKIILQPADLNAARAYVSELLQTGGYDAQIRARKYTDIINGLVAAQSCALGDYQQQREIKKLSNRVRELESQ